MKRLLAIAWLAAAACSPPPDGTDLFRVAASGIPGSLLSVWGDTPQHAFLAGGFVGVDPAMLSNGVVGRLVEYTPATFVTRCTSDRVLWWTTATSDPSMQLVVFAAGEGARVVRYAQGQCTPLTVDVTYAQGLPTFYGALALAPDDVWLVGGSADPTGPRGVVVHFDGTHFTQETTLPHDATQANVFKIDRLADGTLVAVGSGGLVMARDPNTHSWNDVTTGLATSDNWLFTVSCLRSGGECWAVGGQGSGIVLHGYAGMLSAVPSIGGMPLDFLPGLNGVYMQNASNVFIVGVSGFTMHTSGSVLYSPPRAPTTATLHGVGGAGGLVIAVGGELSVSTPDQRGVILIRGDNSTAFSFDGRTYVASGNLRTSLGGAGQGR